MTHEGEIKSNRDKKLEGRSKRKRFVQGTRAFTHAMTNSIVKRAKGSEKPPKAP